MRAQGYVSKEIFMHQDNKSSILLENNGKLSSSKRKLHVNVHYYFAKDCIERKELRIEFLGTDGTRADYYAKPLQGSKFFKFRKTMNL